ncbi:MAG: hypothetical protein JSR49_11425 [Proteobacteria bacterium]|nr:hypothetical protein [Pseudomonadota bacterium]
MLSTQLHSFQIEKRSQGIVDALHQRIDPRVPPTQDSNMYRSMSLIEIAREFFDMHGENTRGMSRFEVAGHALQSRAGGMMGAADFPSLLANVASKRLRSLYDENPGTYTIWARRAPDAMDFKAINTVQMSGAPQLLQTNEHGEFKYGYMRDSGETYALLTYGRIVSLTRQAMVNDDLRGFDRLIQSFASSARRLENRLAYAQLTANANLSDGVALFDATTHKNLQTGGGSALQLSSLAAGRAAMRVQKGLIDEELNLAPAYLIVPAALEQTAYQLTSPNYVPTRPADVNEFRTAGRTALTPVVEPLLDAVSATGWYLACDSSQVDTVEYCYLNGSDGPVVDSQPDFSRDGVSFRCRLDFAAKAVDYRGLYCSAGT